MSKRSGTFVTLRDVVDEVGRDPVRFMMLYRKNDAPLDFDLAKVLEQSKDNPVFYVQYAHTRAKSVFRNVSGVFPQLTEASPELVGADLTRLNDPGEIDLMRKLAAFPIVLAAAAKSHEPHRLAFYLYDLASAFHAQWTKGNEMPHLRIYSGGRWDTDHRAPCAYPRQSAGVGEGASAILGVHAPVEMR